MFEYLIGGFILGIFAGMAIVKTWNYFWATHGERPFAALEAERDMLRTVVQDTDKATLLQALENTEAENLRSREALDRIANYEFGGHTPPEMRAIAKAAIDDDLSKLATQQKPTEEAMLRANPSCGMDGCLWERDWENSSNA